MSCLKTAGAVKSLLVWKVDSLADLPSEQILVPGKGVASKLKSVFFAT